MDFEKYLVPQSRFGWLLYVLFTGTVFDVAYNQSQVLLLTVQLARSFETFITLLFSGLLVVLYWEQREIQKENIEIAERQAEIQENQVEIMQAQQRPRLWFGNWDLSDKQPDIEEFRENPYWDRALILKLNIGNRGEGTAHNLRVEYDFYFSLDKRSYSYFYPLAEFNLRSESAPFVWLEQISEQMLDKNVGESLDVNETRMLVSQSNLGIQLYSDKAEETEDSSGMKGYRISTAKPESFGEALEKFYFNVDEVAIEIRISYERNSGEKEKELLTRYIADSEEVETVENIIENGSWTRNFSVGDSSKLFEKINLFS